MELREELTFLKYLHSIMNPIDFYLALAIIL